MPKAVNEDGKTHQGVWFASDRKEQVRLFVNNQHPGTAAKKCRTKYCFYNWLTPLLAILLVQLGVIQLPKPRVVIEQGS